MALIKFLERKHIMKTEHIVYLLVLWFLAHLLLAKSDLNPKVRSLLQLIECKALTNAVKDAAVGLFA
jgi:hypothetical protein